ncbi:MAG TPA: hypothetical protein VGL69_14385 [Solirubrobacteraceae bacterium]
MSARGEQLQRMASDQLERLERVVAALDPERAREPCPGRAKLGDGSIGTVATHTARNYEQIAGFVAGEADSAGEGGHGHGGAAAFDGRALAPQLAEAQQELGAIGALSDRELDAVPPAESFRFCDGQRTLEQVLAALLQHQDHQLAALLQHQDHQLDALEGAVPGAG